MRALRLTDVAIGRTSISAACAIEDLRFHATVWYDDIDLHDLPSQAPTGTAGIFVSSAGHNSIVIGPGYQARSIPPLLNAARPTGPAGPSQAGTRTPPRTCACHSP